MADAVKSEINNYIRKKRYEKALELCNNPEYESNHSIQHKKMEIFCMQKKYKEAVAVGERPEFANDVPIQLKLIEAYRELKEFDKAVIICEREEFANLRGFVQLRDRLRKDLLKTYGAKVNVTADDFKVVVDDVKAYIDKAKNSPNNSPINTYLTALGICNKFPNDINAIFYKVQILRLMRNYQNALNIACNKKYCDNKDIFIERLKIMKALQRFDEILAIINNSQFKNDPEVLNIKQSILVKKDKGNPPKKTPNNEQLLSFKDVLNNIESGAFNLKKIQALEINDFIKYIFTLACLEVNQFSIHIIRNCLNEMITNYQDKPDYLEIIIELDNHFKKQNPIYNKSLYIKALLKADNIDLSSARKK